MTRHSNLHCWPKAVAFALAVLWPGFTQAQVASETPEDSIRFVVDLADARNHYVTVEMFVPVVEQRTELMMAVWTPGSYLVREYARHIDSLEITNVDGAALNATKVRKNRWVVETTDVKELKVRYRLYCNEMSVRTNWVGNDFAVLNGAPTFLTVVGRLDLPHVVECKLPVNWKRTATSLVQVGSKPHHFRATSFHEIVDSPIVAGNIAVHPFVAGGVQHQLVNVGGAGYWDGDKAAADLRKVVEAHQAMWSVTPYDRYLFLNVISESRGGLEHDFSTLMMTSRWAFRDQKKYRDWLSLASHEFFHTWNVRRLRPRSLQEYDYESEVYTPSLWIAEGITSYFEDVLLARAGLIDRKEYLRRLSDNIKSVETNTGRLKQSLTESSFDTWIKFYRPDENSSNTRISYYRKGCVAAFLLDAKIREATSGAKSLDDVMRRLYVENADTGYEPADFRRVASQVAGLDLSDWFASVIDSTDELEYRHALDYWGLQLGTEKPTEKTDAQPVESTKETAPKPWLGFEGVPIVSRVQSDSPASDAGVHTGDELLGINGFRVTKEALDSRIKQYKIGDEIELLIARRGKITTLSLTIAAKPKREWFLTRVKEPSEAQRDNLDAWLGAEQLANHADAVN